MIRDLFCCILVHVGIAESVVILRYLCRTYKVADHWYPKDVQKQARVDECLMWQYNRELIAFIPLKSGQPASVKTIVTLEERMIENLDLIENIWLKNKLFLSGDEISISDLVGACEVEQPRIAGFDPRENRHNLTKRIAGVFPLL
ncbi:Glutathione S-transferase, C-terminal-like [Cinara cedri]|uniref:Glutathione S-transferase, C-terminal-like n=1 Tax=Cinara cedri TaxID=506608 RepID=A0A5E4M3A7_9HEMI|nr:Glutathione S-transferase, C-terminal-like [Cinara cedri]